MARQTDLECGALAGETVDKHEPAGLLDDAVDHREAEPGAGARLLGRKERVEDAREVVLGDADAGVGDLDDDIIPGRHHLRPAPQIGRLMAVRGADAQGRRRPASRRGH